MAGPGKEMSPARAVPRTPGKERTQLIVMKGELTCCTWFTCVFPMDLPPKTSLFEICPAKAVPLHERLVRFAIPFVIGGFYILLCFLLMPYESALLLGGLMLAYLVPPAGKESIVPLGVALGFPWWLIAFSIGLMDVLAGIFMALNFDVALRIPLLGQWISKILQKGNDFVRRRPWLEKFCFFGVVLFVMFPLQGSGGIGGSLVGWMAGLSPARTLLAITIGAFLGCSVIATGSQAIKGLLLSNHEAGVIALAGVVAVFVLSYLAYRWKVKR